MWHSIVDFWLNAKRSGLGQDAVIEIMIALLGIMMAVMAILSGLVTLVFAALGFFGYKAIEEKSIQAAELKAADIAEKKIQQAISDYRDKEQGAALGAVQPAERKKQKPTPKSQGSRKINDAGLRKD